MAAAMPLRFQSLFQQYFNLKRTRAGRRAYLVGVSSLQPPCRYYLSCRCGRVKFISRRCQMTSIADRVAGPPLADQAPARDVAAAPVALPVISLPSGAERELRLDLFRGLALWLIFIDHLPNNVLTWFTIRNYGFSDATEIFIFISGYTSAFV